MSGFERSAPIPGSQGPRRSQMVRYNNAPPPLTPWRAEVLEAQKQIEAAKKDRSSRSRSRSRSRRRAKGGTGGGSSRPSVSAPSTEAPTRPTKNPSSALAPETGVVLRQARERGEGWYAAVARAAESWESVPTGRKRPPQTGKSGKPEEVGPDGHKIKTDKKGKGKPEKDETEAERQKREEKEDRTRQDDLRREKENEEQRAREEYEARAEERRLKAEEEKKRAEEERAKMEVLKKKRQEKLKGAFALEQDDDEDDPREKGLVRKAAEKKKVDNSEGRVPLASGGVLAKQAAAPSTALMPSTTARPVDPELSEKLRFEPGLDPAEAFMRLQERKRKGRRAEFGGPPRGCSPWRDGRRGISWQNDEEEQR
mmetsp:Transcript_90913/g.266192  ORF Transcript_90913/g.266192 Transcript_90913/m.266192 type:complete len:369 (+) Transcript_90913:117-1223(+)